MSAPSRRRAKLAILTNLLTPYRLPLFERLGERYDVTVLLSGREGNREQWADLERRAAGIQVRRAWGISPAWRRRQGGAVMETRYLHLNPGLFTELFRLRPDAIVTDEMGFRTAAALAYAGIFGTPTWVWWGGTLHTEREIGAGRRRFRRWLVPRVRRWFSYGATSTQYLASLGVSTGAVVEIQNCVAEEPYRVPVPPALRLEVRPVLLSVGRLVPGKGVDLLLEAADALQREGLRFSLLLVGSGPDRPALERRARELSLSQVHFHVPDSLAGMPAIYRSGDVLVFPTRDDVWGLVVNEALWSGLPALVSVYAGCAPELVPPLCTFDPLDPADFRTKLRMAVRGELPAPDLARLRRMDEIAEIMIRELDPVLSGER